MRSPVSRFAALTFTTLLVATGSAAGARDKAAPVSVLAPPSGPAADYPMVLGDPFIIDGVTYTPQDKLNFDQVGYAGTDQGVGITIAHRTLPLPSYAEVTSLDSGRTILVRVTRRGPMSGPNIVDLSPAAAAQLGLAEGRAPIRIRRVNPPEPERAALREGREAPLRMDTPKSLVAVLRRKLEPGATAALLPLPKATDAASPPVAVATPVPVPAPVPAPVAKLPGKPVAKAAAKPAPAVAPEPKPPVETPKAAAKPSPATSRVVQIGAYSDKARAEAVAKKAGGQVSPSGKLFRVRMGPFTTRGQAEAALSKAKAAGYSEARIQSAD